MKSFIVFRKVFRKKDKEQEKSFSYDVAVIQWITSCHKNSMTTRVITSIAAAAEGSRRRLPKAGVERSSYVGIAYIISVKLSN